MEQPHRERKRPRSWILRWAKRLAWTVLAGLLVFLALLVRLAFLEEEVVFDTEAAEGITHTPFEQLVPGPAVPPGQEVMGANNNVDAVAFDGRYYLAYRTAPTHFASPNAKLIMVSSADLKTWAPEHVVHMPGHDLREPRFMVYQGRMFFFFFQGGKRALAFEPERIHAIVRDGAGEWSEPRAIYKPGFVAWRAKVHENQAYLSVYNGAGLYTLGERPGELRLLVSDNGFDWREVSAKPQVIAAGAEEGAFAFDAEGNLTAVVRLEVSGALVCTAPRDNLAEWTCTPLNHKYDSSLLLEHGGAFYLVARRNVAGAFNRGQAWLPTPMRRAWRLGRYWFTRKRTALYQVHPEEGRVTPLFDFPSRGDTAFPAIIPLDANRYYLVNYSSPIDGPDWPWLLGQVTGSRLYAATLRFD